VPFSKAGCGATHAGVHRDASHRRFRGLGLGFRVPAIVVSPWSVGGYVCSDALDHTSLIRLIEARLGVSEPNISVQQPEPYGARRQRADPGEVRTDHNLRPNGPLLRVCIFILT